MAEGGTRAEQEGLLRAMSALTSMAPASLTSARAAAASCAAAVAGEAKGAATGAGTVFGPELALRYLPNKMLTWKLEDPEGQKVFMFSLVHDTPSVEHGWAPMKRFGKQTPFMVDEDTRTLFQDMDAVDWHVRWGKNAKGGTVEVGVNGIFFTQSPAAPLRQAMLSAEHAMSAEDARDAAEADAVVDALSALSVADAADHDEDAKEEEQEEEEEEEEAPQEEEEEEAEEDEDAEDLDPRLVQSMCAALQRGEED